MRGVSGVCEGVRGVRGVCEVWEGVRGRDAPPSLPIQFTCQSAATHCPPETAEGHGEQNGEGTASHIHRLAGITCDEWTHLSN